jgi:hypothetical protein
MRITTIFSVLFFVVVGSHANAGQRVFWEPLGLLPSVDRLPQPTVSREYITSLRVANWSMILEKTTLEDVQARLGGTVGRRGDASTSLHWICLSGTDRAGRWVLWLESGEIHGGDVGAFELRRIPPAAVLDDRCVALSGRNSGVTLPIPLRLGIKEAEVIKVVGKPTVRLGEILLYVHEHQETIRGEPFDATNVLAVLVRRGVVEAIEVWKTTVS